MGLIKKFSGKKVFLDTAPIIYFIEENPAYITRLEKMFNANAEGLFIFSTSVITLIEVLIHPLKNEETQLSEQYSNILCYSPSIEMLDINADIAKNAAKIRAKYGFKTPDAIQLASALQSGSDFFITNDNQLNKFKELNVILVDQLT